MKKQMDGDSAINPVIHSIPNSALQISKQIGIPAPVPGQAVSAWMLSALSALAERIEALETLMEDKETVR